MNNTVLISIFIAINSVYNLSAMENEKSSFDPSASIYYDTLEENSIIRLTEGEHKPPIMYSIENYDRVAELNGQIELQKNIITSQDKHITSQKKLIEELEKKVAENENIRGTVISALQMLINALSNDHKK